MSKKSPKTSSKIINYFIVIVISAIAIIGNIIWNSDEMQTQLIYMWPYQKEILEYSNKNKIDPFLVAAVIKNESHFYDRATSKAGAIGLMQIMPETGVWIAQQMGINDYKNENLYNARSNIRLGCWYLSELEYEFQYNPILMLIAYNAGRGNAKHWMEENGWNYTFDDINAIPYSDTREYVKKVLRDKEEYRKRYQKHLAKEQEN